METFKQYKRLGTAEAKPVTEYSLRDGSLDFNTISISEVDIANGSPKLGDMIARNPANHSDQWLIAADYWKANFEQEPINA